MEDREATGMRNYGESKTTRIMMATVPHVTAWAGRTKYQADGFLFDWVYTTERQLTSLVSDKSYSSNVVSKACVVIINSKWIVWLF